VPQSVNLKAKNLAKEINRYIQGTTLPITNKGCCYTARVGHTGLQAEEISDNVVAVTKAIAFKAPKIWQSVKLLHLKTDKSVALPIFAKIDPEVLQSHSSVRVSQKKEKKKKQKKPIKKETSDEAGEAVEGNNVLEAVRKEVDAAEISGLIEPKEEEEEEIPQLVPIETGTRVQSKKLKQSSSSTREGVKTSPVTPLGKRRTSARIPATNPGVLDKDPSGPQSPKQLRRGRNKPGAAEKKRGPAPTPEPASPSVTRGMRKAAQSAKKALEMPKRQLRPRSVSQSMP
ncbi:hypothetical protein lerEdw1_014093, partial [Lerista edwardsae]